MTGLVGRAAVVTGAESGIGRACALRFAAAGASVVLAVRDEVAGTAVAAQIVHLGGRAISVHTDVRRREDNERAIDMCVERFGSLDVLVLNAGVNLPKLITESTDEDIEEVLAVNVRGLMYATRHGIPRMLTQATGGSIVIVASKTGLVAQLDSPVYCASKGAAVLFARALALDYARRGIRVNALCPGVIDTPMLERFAASRPDRDAEWRAYETAQPMGRLGTAEECANAALWLASDESSFVTGIALPVDGGFTAM